MKFFKRFLFLTTLLLSLPLWAQEMSFENDKLNLKIETKKISEKLQILAEFTLKNDWHISYENPGDAGVKTEFEFDKNTKLVFQSTPSKFIYEEIITQYGYANKAYYLFETEQTNQNINLKVSWTACRDYCEPEEASFVISPVSTKGFDKSLKKAEQTFPEKLQTTASAKIEKNKLIITLKPIKQTFSEQFYFIPTESSLFAADSPQYITQKKDKLKIIIHAEDIESIPQSGILIDNGKSYLFKIEPQRPHFLLLILLAFVGGLVLNLMPCVLPVLSLKALNLAQRKRHKYRLKNAFSYVLGVLLSFSFIAGALYILRKSGEGLGWGFQLQSPVFIAVMLFIFLLILLYLLDVLKFNIPFLNTAYHFSGINTFLTGFFAVLIASPCTGPFMGAALGYALFENPTTYFPIFLSLGFGYALPFALLELFPNAVRKVLPKPGVWMEKLKYILALPIFLTVVWLSWVLAHQLYFKQEDDVWENYNEKKLQQALDIGRPTFIDFTAKWCLTCLINEQTSLKSEAFLKAAKEKNVLLLKADWTNRNTKILEALKRYQRGSVPLYVFYPKENINYVILPQILTTDIVLSVLNNQD